MKTNTAMNRWILIVALASALTGLSAGAALAASVTYGYDALGRLVFVDYGNGNVVRYGYDAAGNRVLVGSGYPPTGNLWGAQTFVWGTSKW